MISYVARFVGYEKGMQPTFRDAAPCDVQDTNCCSFKYCGDKRTVKPSRRYTLVKLNNISVAWLGI